MTGWSIYSDQNGYIYTGKKSSHFLYFTYTYAYSIINATSLVSEFSRNQRRAS